MSVHGSELKCKYLIKVNPGQVNKPGTHKDRERNTARCRGRARDGGRWQGAEAEQKESEISIVVLRGAFYCRFLLAE